MTEKNSVYEVPRVVIDLVFAAKGLPTDRPSLTRAGQRKAAKTIATIEAQWRRLMLTTDFGILNDVMAVRYQRNGQLKIVHESVRRSGDIELVMPHRYIDVEFANAHLQKQLSWAEFRLVTGTKLLQLHAVEGTSDLRQRAITAAVEQARDELGTNAIPYGKHLVLTQRDGGQYSGYESGTPVHSLYWGLFIAKKVATNLTAMMRLALRGNVKAQYDVKRHDTSVSFERFLERRAEIESTGQNSIENLPVPDFSDAASRTWGIEVEAAGARGVEGPGGGWDRRGDGSLRSAYGDDYYREERDSFDCPHHDHREDIFEDGSWVENPDYDDPDYCDWLSDSDYYDEEDSDSAEFVSPILKFAGDSDLKQLLSELIEEPQNDSAGIHIHVGAGDLTPRQVGGLVFGYQMIEPIITEAYRRNERGYCRTRSARSLIQTLKSSQRPGARKTRRDHGEGDVIEYGDRYLSLNLCALESHGTVEFRAMGPVYEYDHLIKWALFCRELVNMAKADMPSKVWSSIKTWDQLQAAIQRYGKELKALTIAEMEKSIASEELVSA